MTRETAKLLIPLFLFLGLPAAHGFDLWEAWQAARRHSPQYHAAEHTRNAAHETEQQAKAQLLPQVNAAASYRNQPQSGYDKYATQGWSLELNQTLFDKGKWEQYRAGKLATQLADMEFDNSDAALLIEVAKAYLDILTLQDKLAALAAEKAAYRAQIAQAQGRFRAGNATIIDTYEAQSGYDAALAREVDLDTRLLTAQNTLKNATGLDPQAIEPVHRKTLPDWLGKSGERHWLAKAMAGNPELAVRELQFEKSRAELLARKGQRWPSVNLDAGYQDRHNDIRYAGGAELHSRGRGAYVGLSVTVPLYSGGENSSRIRQAEEEMEKNSALLENTRRDITLQVKQAYAQLRGKKTQILAQRRLLATNEAKLASTRLGRRFGVRSTLDEIKAQQDKASAEEQLTEARYGYVEAYLQLLRACGELNQARGTEAMIALFAPSPTAARTAHAGKTAPVRTTPPRSEGEQRGYAVDIDLNLVPIPAKRR